MSSAPAPAEIAADATWLVQALDPASGLVRLLRMSAQDYRAAAFLDDRLLAQPVTAEVRPWSEVAGAIAPGARDDARWIFHIGHVGSTLIARLLGELDGVLAVREPRLLRDLAGIEPERRRAMAEAATRLFSRTFGADQVALVKATSFVSDIAPELVAPGARALFMHASPRAYIEGILAGENSIKELRALAAVRRERMGARLAPFAGKADAELAAEAWACEMTALERAGDVIGPERVLWVDFDALLGDAAAQLERITDFLDLPADARQLTAIAAGPLMGRYSKATEYEYSPALRRELLGQARRGHGADIDRAVGLLETAARGAPLLQRALAR